MTSENMLLSVSKDFDIIIKKFFSIENSKDSTASDDFQKDVKSSIKQLEELTVHVSYLGLFSSNEELDDISTESIKFLLLPFFLGSLTLKCINIEREEVLRMASVYFKDFLKRCTDYQLTDFKDDSESTSESQDDKAVSRPSNRPTPDELKQMGKQRDEKIARYKKKKSMEEKLATLKSAIENPNCDVELLREYYLVMTNQFIYQSFEELESISMERDMLKGMKKMNFGGEKSAENKIKKDAPMSKPLRPFLITRDAIQKKTFGAGYPSLPVLTVDEFYDKRVKDGWFPPGVHKTPSASAAAAARLEQPEIEERKPTEAEEDEEVQGLRERDEWRDTHRTGWGNTYNRS